MKKIKLIRTMIIEYEPNPQFYPEGMTIEEMANYDIDNANDTGDYESLFMGELTSDNIDYEIIE